MKLENEQKNSMTMPAITTTRATKQPSRRQQPVEPRTHTHTYTEKPATQAEMQINKHEALRDETRRAGERDRDRETATRVVLNYG